MSAITVVSPVTLGQSIRTNYFNYCHVPHSLYPLILIQLHRGAVVVPDGRIVSSLEVFYFYIREIVYSQLISLSWLTTQLSSLCLSMINSLLDYLVQGQNWITHSKVDKLTFLHCTDGRIKIPLTIRRGL